MPDWSRRSLLAALGVAGAGVTGGWFLRERTRCRPRVEPQWTYTGRRRLGPSIPSGNDLLVPEGYGVTGSERNHRLAALKPFSAQVQWSVVARGDGFGAPVRADDTVYVGTGSDTVRALDADTGRRLWVYDPGGRETYGGAWGQPLVTGDRVHVGVSHSTDPNADSADPTDFTHRVVALDRKDGSAAWTTAVSGGLWVGPVLTADTLVAAAREGVLHGLDPTTGARLWELNLPGRVTQPLSVIAEGIVAVVTDDGTVAFVDVADATIRRTRTPLRGVTSIARAGDTLYVGGGRGLDGGDDSPESGRVVAVPTDIGGRIDADTGRPRWTYDASVPIDGVAADPELGVFAIDRTGHRHRIADGARDSKDRLVESHDDGCGWEADRRRVTDALFHRGGLYVAAERWTRLYPVEG